MNKPITFDRFIRGTIIILIVTAIVFLINYLSNILLPFFVAWLLAYLVYPMVKFVQYKMHVPTRALSIIVSLLFIILVLALVIWLIIPPLISQIDSLGAYIGKFLRQQTNTDDLAGYLQHWINDNKETVENFFMRKDVKEIARSVVPQLWNMLGQTINVIIGMGVVLITMLYMFFILLDYEALTTGILKLVPQNMRPLWTMVLKDVETAMNSYVRGQSLVALTMGVLFCIGFTIIDFPMAIGLGILIGIMDLVPYLHTFALIPTAMLALMKAANTGQNFWVILASAVAVFCVVQVIIDMIVTPKIMGKAMGLNPAILLLSISVWGSLLGFIGLIIALPLTTLLIAYYKRYITKDT